MDTFATYDKEASELEDPTRFWAEVEEILHVEHTSIGDTAASDASSSSLHARLSTFFSLCDACYDTHLDQAYNSDYLLTRLVESPLLSAASIDECAIALTSLAVAATSLPILSLIYDTLLKLGTRHPDLFRSSFSARQLIPRLVHHFWAARYAEEYNGKSDGRDTDKGGDQAGWGGADWNVKHVRSISTGDPKRRLAEQRNRNLQIRLREKSLLLLYEVCRSHRLNSSDIRSIDATFVNHLFELVEQSRNWQDDTYNYQLIKLIVALNEQFMVSGISSASSKPGAQKSTASASNTVLTVLRTRLNASKTFGENLIFMLNRASSLDAEDVCMQLLILKLLYLLFTTKETAHYFYTNDLKVLVDIFVRELSDLPDDHESLRHTYLRVLHPLLTNTQLLAYPYKRGQIRRLLVGLTSHGHLRDISSTTQRLVDRCLSAQWCIDLDQLGDQRETPVVEDNGERQHTFSVQSIGGGPATLVQAQTVLDAEGISIPVGMDHEPVQGAPSSDATTSEVLTAGAPGDADGYGKEQPRLTAQPSSEDHAYTMAASPRMRTNRVYSVDGLPPQLRASLNEHGISLAAAESSSDSDSASLHTGHAQPQSRPERRDVGTSTRLQQQRNLRPKSATDQPSSSPKRVHSAIDVTKVSASKLDFEAESAQWAGSPNSSWHESLANEQMQVRTRPRARTGTQIVSPSGDALTYSSESRAEEQATPTDLLTVEGDNMNIPAVHVQAASGEGEPVQTASYSVSRRPPPAPPTLDGGGARHRQYRKLGIHPSPSESSLSYPQTDTRARNGGQLSVLGREADGVRPTMVISTPASAGTSREASRAGSPLQSGSLTPTGSSGTGRRRRPPPPPVDRSTKSPRPPTTVASNYSEAPGEPIGPSLSREDDSERADERSGPVHDDRRRSESTLASSASRRENGPQHLSHYMRHLHLSSESGYGW